MPPAADVLERCAGELHSLAFDMRECRTPASYERVVDAAEQVLADARAGMRGRSVSAGGR